MKIGFLLLDGEVTGGQVVAHALMRGLEQAGHEAAAFFPRPGPMVSRITNDGFQVAVLPLGRSVRIDHAALLAHRLHAWRADLLDTHTLFAGNQLARATALIGRVPVVQHVHIEERFSSTTMVAAAQRAFDRATLRIPRRYVAVSEHLRDGLVAAGVPQDRVVVVHNGVALGPSDPPQPQATLRLVCAGRLAPVKGQDVLLEALALAGDGIEVDIVGEDLETGGAHRRHLEERAAILGLGSRVRFLGSRDEIAPLLDSADAVVLPSRDEGLPLVALEALARCRPVVISDVGTLPPILRNARAGLIVEPGSATSLAEALVRLRATPELCAQLGRAGRELVAERFTLERMIERTIAVYENALA